MNWSLRKRAKCQVNMSSETDCQGQARALHSTQVTSLRALLKSCNAHYSWMLATGVYNFPLVSDGV